MRDGGVPPERERAFRSALAEEGGRRRRGQICSPGQGVAVLVGNLPLSPEAGPRAAQGGQGAGRAEKGGDQGPAGRAAGCTWRSRRCLACECA